MLASLNVQKRVAATQSQYPRKEISTIATEKVIQTFQSVTMEQALTPITSTPTTCNENHYSSFVLHY
jgi:Mg/Co/Ni transporter MgtE